MILLRSLSHIDVADSCSRNVESRRDSRTTLSLLARSQREQEHAATAAGARSRARASGSARAPALVRARRAQREQARRDAEAGARCQPRQDGTRAEAGARLWWQTMPPSARCWAVVGDWEKKARSAVRILAEGSPLPDGNAMHRCTQATLGLRLKMGQGGVPGSSQHGLRRAAASTGISASCVARGLSAAGESPPLRWPRSA